LPVHFRRRAILGDGQLLPDRFRWRAIINVESFLGLFLVVRYFSSDICYELEPPLLVYPSSRRFFIVHAYAKLTIVSGSLSLACDPW
jgi:hypothetical protein